MKHKLNYTIEVGSKLTTLFMHQSIESPPPPLDPRGIAEDSEDLTRLMPGFNAHLTTY